MAGIGLVAPNPFLATPGEPPVPWSRWILSFKTYLTASGLDTAEIPDLRRRAILIHCLGAEGQRIFGQLEVSTTGTYDKAVDELEKYFGPKTSVMIERYRFRQRVQGHGEPVKQYVAAITELASKCKFGTLNDELVRDQLIEKTSIPRIRERLLMEDDGLTLKKALDLAIQIEAAMLDAKLLKQHDVTVSASTGHSHTAHQATPVQNIKRPYHNKAHSNHANSKSCSNCGRTHPPKACPAFGKRCNSCSKMHHFSSVCRSTKKSASSVRHVDEPIEGDIASSVFTLSDRISSAHSGQFKECEVQIAGTNLSLMIDVGAKVSILSDKLYHRHFSHCSLSSTSSKLIAYGEPPTLISVLGMVELPVGYKDVHLDSFTFYIAKGESLMGVNLFDALGFQMNDHTGERIRLVDNAYRERYAALFNEFGKCKGYCHAPRVDSSVPPTAQSLRRLPLAVRDEVSKELHRLESDGIIERIDSSLWVSNLVIARRKNGDLRLCVDLRAVNKAIIPDKYPLPTMNELSASFHGAKVFSKLDMRRSYLQVPLAEQSRHLTAFNTHIGMFQYRRMPYGLNSAPSAFQKIVSSVLAGIEGTLNLLDDVVVFGEDKAQHDQRLAEVMTRLAKHNLTLNEAKCTFAASDIDFLGYHVTADGLTPTLDNVAAIRTLPAPTNVKELASFLGTTNFYRKFVPQYAEIAEPLQKLLRKDALWEWHNAQETAFNTLKGRIAEPPVLAHFTPSAETYVTTDASAFAIGAQRLTTRYTTRLTTRYNPQSNGGVERFNRVIKESLKANLADGMTFDKAIQTLLRTYRSTPHSLTGKTPAELMLGRNLRMPFNILKPPVSEPASTQAEAREIERKQQSMKAYTDKRRRAITPKFAIGDWVRVKRPNRKHKLASGVSKPKQIVKKLGSNAFVLDDGTRWNTRRLIASKPGNMNESDWEDTFPFPTSTEDQEQQRAEPRTVRRSQRLRRRPGYLRDYRS
ncbi:uncharacterized protein K02A2.6-like [Strongylocentrotus purpuratus]|uniref:Reverse transcriptase n=1 Tax=Strongylocentrotus purpuratus TaxID=7668 RepID=A0A7M7NSH3_STRPU|nr:uncharacterized protein K02A2.6-like [Strongylocentrotus purpuratus]